MSNTLLIQNSVIKPNLPVHFIDNEEYNNFSKLKEILAKMNEKEVELNSELTMLLLQINNKTIPKKTAKQAFEEANLPSVSDEEQKELEEIFGVSPGFDEDSIDETESSKIIDQEVDSIIKFYFERDSDQRDRYMEILKMRGTNHSLEVYSFKIDNNGLSVGSVTSRKHSPKN